MGIATMNLVKIKKRKHHKIEHESNVTYHLIINHTRFHIAIKKNYNQMKSNMTTKSNNGMIIDLARFHLTIEKKL